MKIGEAAEEKPKSHPIRGIALAGLGSALGWGAGELAARKMKFFNQPPASPAVLGKRVRTAKIILPIMSGAAVILADRYRDQMKRHFGTEEQKR